VVALLSRAAHKTAGTLERAMDMVDSDESMEVRVAGCEALGHRADERVMSILERYTGWPTDEPRLYSACARGLISAWSSFAPHEQPLEPAYRLTLAMLEQKPRGETNPPWTMLSLMTGAAASGFAERAPWYDSEEVLGLLAELIADKEYAWLGRTQAVDVFVKLGGDIAVLEKIRETTYAGIAPKPTKTPDQRVVKAMMKKISPPKPVK